MNSFGVFSFPSTLGDSIQIESEEAVMIPATISITSVAEAFFHQCEAGKGWEVAALTARQMQHFQRRQNHYSSKSTRAVHRMDEGDFNSTAGCSLRSEVIRDRQSQE
jgi:hypothetical protein